MFVSQDFRYSHFSLRTNFVVSRRSIEQFTYSWRTRTVYATDVVKCGANIETKTDGRCV